jgi:biopolymer transport protein ExbD
MVDLAFLLITFFMLTTSLAKPRAMPVVMPDNGNVPGPVSDIRTMTICLGKNNHALWYMGMADKPLANPALTNSSTGLNSAIAANIKQIRSATGKDLIVLIKPAEHSVYADLVDVIDQMGIQQVQSYAIAPLLPKDIELLKQKGIY